MNTKIAVGTALLAGYVATAVTQSVQPLNARTGLWQMSETTTWTGLPPEMANMMENGRTHSYTSCVKPKDLTSNPWQQGSKQQCTWTVLNSTATDMELKGRVAAPGCKGQPWMSTAKFISRTRKMAPARSISRCPDRTSKAMLPIPESGSRPPAMNDMAAAAVRIETTVTLK